MAADHLSTTLAALADPTRRALLARLALGETSVTTLAEPFPMSLTAVSKHLKVLERAGLIVRGREAQWRPGPLEPGPPREVDDWLERYRRYWDESLDRLDAYLQDLQATPERAGKGKRDGKRRGSRFAKASEQHGSQPCRRSPRSCGSTKRPKRRQTSMSRSSRTPRSW